MAPKHFWIACFCLGMLLCCPPAGEAGPPDKGSTLPAFTLPRPTARADVEYLGISAPAFALGDVSAEAVLVEILGVYCPRCREQAPLFNALLARLEKGELKGRVKMIGIAAGATPMEVAMVRKEWKIRHPVLPDESFEVHKLLGEPQTPFILLVDRKGRVLYAHTGVLKDMDAFYQLIKTTVR